MMLSDEEKQSFTRQADEIRQKIKELRQNLDGLSHEKESWFAKRTSYKDEIGKIIGSVRSLRDERNTLTSQVHATKSEREQMEKKLPELTKRFEELKKEKQSLMTKLGVEKDYGKLRREIEQLENSVETDAMSFEKEKKVMAQLKIKKRELAEASALRDIGRKIREIRDELDVYRTIRNVSHSKVQSMAKNSQEKHVNMIEESKKIDELRAKEEEAFQKFKELKAQCKDLSDAMHDQQQKLAEVNQKLGLHREESRENERKEHHKSLAEKRKDIEEKLMSGKKLSTEDFLILQSGDAGEQ